MQEAYSFCRVAVLGSVAALVLLLPGRLDAQPLPSGWTLSDVGGPQIPGYAAHVNGTFTLSGAGSGIGGSSDSFTFVHRDLTGDGTVVARVGSVADTHRWTAAGLMIRQTLSEGSRHAFVFALPAREVGFLRRTADGASSARSTVDVTVPVWLKLERRAAMITASWSPDGVAWTVIGSDTVSMTGVVRVGLAVTSHVEAASALATFSNVNVAPLVQSGGPLPLGWHAADIGPPVLVGSSSYDQGTFGLSGAGAGIDGTWDEFHFAYTNADGDLDVVARVAAVGNTTERSKAGVMIRDTLTPNGAHASIAATSGEGTLFQRRRTGGGSTVTTVGTTSGTPVWVKLTVRGGTVSAYESMDGVAWTSVGSDTLTLPSPYLIGLAVTSHNSWALVTANVDQVSIHEVAPQPNQSPSVVLTAPPPGSTYTAPATITLAANATDSDGTVSRVDFHAGSTLIASDSTSPYSATWSNVPAGAYSLTAIATDNAGTSTVSGAVGVTINATTNLPPQVAITAPADGATFTAPATFAITASASDSGEGAVVRVDFFAGSTLLGSDTTASYSVTAGNMGAGTYTLTAAATDNGGATTTSAPRTITVTAAPQQQRWAAFTPSADHSTLVNSYLFEVFASSANPATAPPLASQNLGKPAPVNNEILADVTAAISALAPGTYQATISAVGSGGSSRSVPFTFTR